MDMNYQKLADLLFPQVTETPEECEARFPARNLPEGAKAELLSTIRHEAFHQYLSYALSMIPSSPWFNEGYAQYFENEDSPDWRVDADI